MTSRKGGDNPFLTTAGSTLLMFGVMLTVYGLNIVWNTLSIDWVETKATVTSVAIRRSVHNADTKSPHEVTYCPQIQYQYWADGRLLESDKYRLRNNHTEYVDHRDALHHATKYRIGDVIPVFYDSHNPSVAVLQNAVNLTDFTALLIGVLFGLVGALLCKFDTILNLITYPSVSRRGA